jgi:hypothetical protein
VFADAGMDRRRAMIELDGAFSIHPGPLHRPHVGLRLSLRVKRRRVAA